MVQSKILDSLHEVLLKGRILLNKIAMGNSKLAQCSEFEILWSVQGQLK
jgi:hypothetical protein